MKRAKKLLALILTLTVALTMGVSICVTAFAAGETDGSVTVTNTHQGQTYTLYKLFDAQYNTTTGAVTYTLPAGKTLGDGEAWFEITDNGFVVAGDVYLAVVECEIAWATCPHVNLFEAFPGCRVDYLDSVGCMHGGIEFSAVMY